MELTATQIVIIGLVASVLAQGIKMLSAWLKKDLGEKAIMVIVFVVSLVLSFIWIMPLVPQIDWSVESIVAFLIQQIGSVLGFSVVIYTLLLKTVFEKMNLTKARFLGAG